MPAKKPSPAVSARLDLLFSHMAEKGMDAAIINRREDVYYFSGFTGTDTVLFLVAKRRKLFLVTDARYTEEAEKTAPGYAVTMWKGGFAQFMGKLVKKFSARSVGFVPAAMTVQFHAGVIAEAGKRLAWLTLAPAISAMRAVKSPTELTAMKKALACAEAAFIASRRNWKAGMTEKDVKDDLEWAMRRHGAEDAAFETIVAVAANASLPHAHAGNGKLRPGKMLLIDFGARVGFYNSDLTRTMWVTDIPSVWQKRYQTVLECQLAAIEKLGPGIPGTAADAAARRILARAKIEPYFTHSLGHGVGLAVHEEPRLSHVATEPLLPGNIVTVEPGVYFPGSGGIRIEDMAVIGKTGATILSSLPKDLASQVI